MSNAPESGVMKTALVYGALIFVASIYGGWALVAKMVLKDGANPMVFAFYRCFGGALILFAAMLVSPKLACSDGTSALAKVQQISQADWVRFGMLGVLMAANIVGFILGAARLSALTVSIFQPTIPVFAMTFSVIFGVEQISKHKLAGVVFMIVGAMSVAAFGEAPHASGGIDHATRITGILFVLMNVSATALFLVHNKDVVRTYEPVFATFMTYFVAAVVILAGAVGSVGFDSNQWLLEGRIECWLGLSYAVCLTTALNYSIMAWANQQSSPVVTSSSTTVQPVAAATLSTIFLGVGLRTGQMVGAAFIITGLLIMIKGQAEEAEEKERERLVDAKIAAKA